ncbi:MAG: hypothetical protein ABI378_14515 [Chitinophagaceae bacterium]
MMKSFLVFFFASFLVIIVASFLLPIAVIQFGIALPVIVFIALVLFVVFYGFKVARKGLKPKDIPNGLPATATVIKSYQGNMKMTLGGVQEFYQLEIEVNVKNNLGETWPAKIIEMIPITQVGLFQPGLSFAVKYDPNDRTKVVFDQTPGGTQNSRDIPGYGTVNAQEVQSSMQAAPKDITLRLQAANALYQDLKVNGVASEAIVKSCKTLYATYLAGSDAVLLELQVNALDREPFEAEIVSLVSKSALPKLAPGKTVFVSYDYNNPMRVCMTGTDKVDSSIQL